MSELWSDEGMRDYSMTTKDKASFLVTGFGVACLVAAFAFYINIVVIPNERTTKIVNNECRKLLTNEKVVVDYDFWGEELVYDRTINDKKVIAIVTSKGRDKELNTQDDISRTMVDWNKSELLGEYIGSRAKRFTKGLIDGLKDEGFNQ